jgi:hypothetical protein
VAIWVVGCGCSECCEWHEATRVVIVSHCTKLCYFKLRIGAEDAHNCGEWYIIKICAYSERRSSSLIVTVQSAFGAEPDLTLPGAFFLFL